MRAAFKSFGTIAANSKSGAITLAFSEKVSLGLAPKLQFIHPKPKEISGLYE